MDPYRGCRKGLKLVERAPGVTIDAIVEATAAHLMIPEVVPEMALA